MRTDKHSLISRRLYQKLISDPYYAPQISRVMVHDMELEPDFLGFTSYYYYLAQMIPKDRVIYDMGCNCACQAWYFRKHRAYIGVDLLTPVRSRIKPPNAKHYKMSILDFVMKYSIKPVHFAICSYVPPWDGDNEKIVKEKFRHVFVFYPESLHIVI